MADQESEPDFERIEARMSGTFPSFASEQPFERTVNDPGEADGTDGA